MSERSKRFGLLILGLVVTAIFVNLGNWQLERAAAKRAANRQKLADAAAVKAHTGAGADVDAIMGALPPSVEDPGAFEGAGAFVGADDAGQALTGGLLARK